MARRMFNDPDSLQHILGSNYVKREHQPLIAIGTDFSLDRIALGRLGVNHPAAALRLNRVIQELRIRTMDGFARAIHEIGNFKGLGLCSYHTALTILASAGYDPDNLHGEKVTYTTLKTRAMKASRKRPAKRPRRAGPPSEAAGATP